MAKKPKKTTYQQTIKGSRQSAQTHQRQANLLGRLITARREGQQKLGAQYNNALARNKATRESVVGDLLNGFKTAQEGYDRSEVDSESNLGNSTSASMLNRAREGTNAMSELSNMQAGETDRIKGMAASLRNMKANVDAGANDYATAITSINNSLGDLNSSVTANVNNALREQNASNASAFGEYQAGRQQAYSDLVDLYGQQGSAYEQAASALGDKKSNTASTGTKNIKTTQTDKVVYGKLGNRALTNAQNAFNQAANSADYLSDLQGEKFTDPIMTIDQMNAETTDPNKQFHEAAMKQNQSNLDDLANGGTLRKMAAPEGAKLRKATVA